MDISALRLADFPHYHRLIKMHLPAKRNLRIADLGCGYGQLLYFLKALGYRRLEGVDLSTEQVALAHRLGLPEVQHGDLMSFLSGKERAYDALFLMDVLEHLEMRDTIALLQSCWRALGDDGCLILHVPNAEGLFGMRVRYGDLTHETCFTPQSMRQLGLATGFRQIQAKEEKPVVHGLKSLARRALWSLFTLRERLLLLAETGSGGQVLSQNMLVIMHK